MVLVAFLHMCRVFFTGAYKSPRQFNWVVGVGLLLLTLGLSFTGYLLPWDQLAFWAITVGSNIAGYAPWLGAEVKYLLLGGNVIGAGALLRFYVLHCVILPLLAIMLVALHFYRVRKDGLSAPPLPEPPPVEEMVSGRFPPSTRSYGLMALTDRPGQPVVEAEPDDEVLTWPHLLHRELLLLLVVLVALHAVALLFNAPLEEIAIEMERYQRLGHVTSDANLRSPALHRIKDRATVADGALHYSTLDADSAWVEEVIARCWTTGDME